MLLIWYNPHHHNFYSTYIFLTFEKKVGYTNGYDHFIVQIFYFYDKKLLNIIDHSSLYSERQKYKKKKKSLKKRFLKRLIRFLNKLDED